MINCLNELATSFGLPTRVISDRGTTFTSKIFEQYCDDNCIQHIKNAVRTNGQVKRVNQTILSSLRTTTEDPRDWDVTLHRLEWSIYTQRYGT